MSSNIMNRTGAVLLIIIAIVAFGGGYFINDIINPPPEPPETLVVATWGAQWGEATEVIGAKFTARYGNPVLIEYHAGASGVVVPKISSAWPEVKIDVVFVSPGICYQLADEGYLAELTRDKVPVIDEIFPAQRMHYPEMTNPEQKIVGLGIYATGGAKVAWRPSIMEPIMGEDWKPDTWEELLDPRLKDKIMIPYPGMGVGGIIVDVAWQFGGTDEDPEEGFIHLKELAETGNIGGLWTTEADAMRMFSTGETPVAYILNGFHMTGMAAEGVDIEWVPYLEDTPYKFFTSSADFVGVVDGPRKDIAMEFVNFFLSTENNQYYAEKVGSPPSNMNSEIPETVKPYFPSPEDVQQYGRTPDAQARAAHIDEWTTRWDTEIAPLIQK